MVDGYLSARESPQAPQAVFTLQAFDSSQWIAEAPGDDDEQERFSDALRLWVAQGVGADIRTST
jgi:hypothetical protein